jgi:ubiquitin carboxyl-terminal hydrolase L5
LVSFTISSLFSTSFTAISCAFRPIFGLIFLFKYRPGEETTGKLDPNNKDVYFSQQVINNACATQAIVNLLLNLDQDQVKLGPVLENFQKFTKELDPQVKNVLLICLIPV